MKYVNNVLKRKSFIDFINAIKKVDTKEWTEIFSIYRQVLNVTKGKKFDILYDIGCGKRPTLGVFARLNLKTFRNVSCIDPQLNVKLAQEIVGITLFNYTLEQYMFSVSKDLLKEQTAIVCCNHSHVPRKTIEEFLNMFKSWIYIVNPCCIDNKLINKLGYHYHDTHIQSAKKDIYIYSSEG